LYIFFLCGDHQINQNLPVSQAFFKHIISYFRVFLSLYDILQYADLAHVTYPALGKTIFIIFMILVPILLLNMLIAMMGNTYALVIARSEKEWMKQVTL